MDARNAVADRDDRPDFGDIDLHGVAADLVPDDLGDLFRSDIHLQSSTVRSCVLHGRPRNPPYRGSANRWRSAASWVATLPSYTVLPIRVTMPPISAGSTFVVSVTVRPIVVPSRCCSRAA